MSFNNLDDSIKSTRERRKSWDKYFMMIAKLTGSRSKCLSRKIGAVLVKDESIIATGYNGPAKGVPHCEWRDNEGKYMLDDFGHPFGDLQPIYECPRKRMGYKSGEGMASCPATHAEANTICQAARLGISTNGATLYCYCPTPCTDCAKELINAGIKRVVCLERKESRPFSPLSSERMFKQAGVALDVLPESELTWNNEI